MDQNQYRFIIMLWMFYFLCSIVQGASVPLPKITLSQTGEADNVTITAVTEMISSHTTESLHTSSVADDYVSQVSDIYNKDIQTASDINVSLISVIYSNDTHTGESEEPDVLTEQTSHHSMMPAKYTTSTSTSVTTSNTAHTLPSSTKYEENITTSSYTEESTLHYGVSHIYINDTEVVFLHLMRHPVLLLFGIKVILLQQNHNLFYLQIQSMIQGITHHQL